MKLLKSAYHDQGWIEMRHVRYEVKPIALAHLWPSVPKAKVHKGIEFFEPLKKDTKKNGMRHPIMVYHSTWGELIEQKKIWNDAIEPLPFYIAGLPKEQYNNMIYVVWGGSNRWHVARELGYDHIDCALMPSYDCAYDLQKVMRAPFAKYYQGMKK